MDEAILRPQATSQAPLPATGSIPTSPRSVDEVLRLLAEVGHLLGHNEAVRPALARLCERLVPALADGCSVLIREGESTELLAHADAGLIRRDHVAELVARYALRETSIAGMRSVLRAGKSQLIPVVTAELVEALSTSSQHAEAMRKVGICSAIVVPISLEDRAHGVILFSGAAGRAPFVQADLQLADELGRRVSAFLQARLHAEHAPIEQLARELAQSQARERAAREEMEALARKRAQELESTRLQLLQVEKLATAGQLAAGVCHEINNPLAFVLANLDLLEETLEGALLEGLEASTNEARSCVAEAKAGAVRIRDIVRDLRAFARDDEEKDERVDVHDALEFALSMANASLRHRAEVVRDFKPTAQVCASASQLSHVFLQLLVNAAQALPDGHARENRVYVRSGTRSSGEVFVTVEDTGRGIAPEHLHRIFEPFFTTRGSGEGRGMGLAVAHGTIARLGGNLTVESEPGKGARFTVVLPPASDLTAEAPLRRATAPRNPAVPRVLVIDDEQGIQRLLRRVLEKSCQVTLCDSGRDALTLLQKETFDVILCDLMMPDVTGMELHAELVVTQPQLLPRLVFMTGVGQTPRVKSFLDSVGNTCLAKPFEVEAVRACVRRTAALSELA